MFFFFELIIMNSVIKVRYIKNFE